MTILIVFRRHHSIVCLIELILFQCFIINQLMSINPYHSLEDEHCCLNGIFLINCIAHSH